MQNQSNRLKNHYNKQKKVLDELRKHHISSSKQSLFDAQNKVFELAEIIRKLSTAIQIADGNDTDKNSNEYKKLNDELNNAKQQHEKAVLRLKEEEINWDNIQQFVNVEFNSDLSHLMQTTREQIAHPTPLTVEKVEGLNLSNYEKFDKFDPEGHRCMGYYRVNGRNFTLWKSEIEGDQFRGTTRVNPQYDDKALTTMYGEDYFGEKATLQVGIPDRGKEEIQRRKNISTLQVNEWRDAGIEVNNRRVVEIGGGSGYLSEEVKNQGGTPLNVELCQERCDSCEERGIKTYNGFIQVGVANSDDNLGYQSADVVACYDLLEHIVNPHQGFIQSVNAVLKKDGYLCIRIPEGTEPTLHLVDHVNHFSFQSLKRFLEHYGFEYVVRPEGKGKFEQPGEGHRYSGTFREGSFEAKKDSDEKQMSEKFRMYVPKTNASGKDENIIAKHPIGERTIENMTMYFRKKRDCDYSILDKYKVSQKLKL